jgi:glutamate racemase
MAKLGIFDSGVGGLTVAGAIAKEFPNANIIYYGDTEHMPYGDKSADTIRGYCTKIVQYLNEKGVGGVVIACNTASAHAYEFLLKEFPNLPIWNMIDPVVDWLNLHCPNDPIAVIATRGTIQSGAYPRKLLSFNPNRNVFALATPLLAPLVEENIENPDVILGVLNHYLNRPEIKKAKALVLACTHYPILIPHIKSILGPDIRIIDPGEVLAKELIRQQPAALDSKEPDFQCKVSDYTDAFAQIARNIFNADIELDTQKLS